MQQTNGISSLQSLLATQAVSETKTAVPAKAANDESSSSAKSDKTSLSAAAASVTASSDVRADKVASLQQAIASGTYNVSSGEVADKIITSLLS
jgi:negative regulator of flagellin synthesis FlgM